MTLPLFKLTINPTDDTGVSAIALVDEPAIEANWMAFKKALTVKLNIATQAFKQVGDKQVIRGPVMVPDMQIYRTTPDGQEFEVMFDKDTIYQMVKKYFKQKNTDKVNIMHDPLKVADNVYLIESFIVDSAAGINTPQGFVKQPDGTWFISMSVDNAQIWNDFVKTGIFQGFSLEGRFQQTEVKLSILDDKELLFLSEMLR